MAQNRDTETDLTEDGDYPLVREPIDVAGDLHWAINDLYNLMVESHAVDFANQVEHALPELTDLVNEARALAGELPLDGG